MLEFDGVSARFVKQFFGLDEDYGAIKRALQRDKAVALAMRKYHGLRIIQQDPWECTVAFLCSQFSNIKKIRGNLECIAQKFGKPVVFMGREFFTFPNLGEINDAVKLKQCAVGFRAKYIISVNGCVSDAWFAKLRTLRYEKAKEKLMDLPGIGEKVADCILLFSLGFTEAFPVDVWMERALKENYLKGRKLPLKKMGAWGREHWGKLAGYAQQYLYHWRRLRP
jgi:N-glycosylase/DNA lyase